MRIYYEEGTNAEILHTYYVVEHYHSGGQWFHGADFFTGIRTFRGEGYKLFFHYAADADFYDTPIFKKV